MTPVPLQQRLRSWRARVEANLAGRSDFTRNVAKLFSGTLLRTAISMAAIPLVTRLYVAEDFGDLQLLLSIASTFVAIATLKYETAIVLPADRDESDRVALLALVVMGGLTAVLGLLTWLFGARLLGFFDAERLEPQAGLVVLAFVAGGLLRWMHHVLTARKAFGGLARNMVWQVAATQAGYVGGGLVRPGFLTLFASQMAGHALAVGLALRLAPLRVRGVRPRDLWALARKYRKFPAVNTPGVFANNLALELPVFMLARFFDADVVGYYMLTDRLLNQPAAMIGRSVAQVYLQSAAEARHRSARELLDLYRTTVRRLALLALPFGVVVAVAAPPAARWVLGEAWVEVGVYMQLLVLWKCAAFVASPVTHTYSIVNRQEIGVLLMVASAVARFAAMYAFSASPREMLAALSVTGAAFALVQLAAMDRILAGRAAREAGAPPAP